MNPRTFDRMKTLLSLKPYILYRHLFCFSLMPRAAQHKAVLTGLNYFEEKKSE